jgi:ankyrin repeat protein
MLKKISLFIIIASSSFLFAMDPNKALVDAIKNRNRLAPLQQRNAIYAALAAGANPRTRVDRLTALHYLAQHSAGVFTVPVLDRLLSRSGADINVRDGIIGSTPLMLAVSSDSPFMVRILLAKGARIESRDAFKKLALHSAHSAAVVDLLLDAGADIDARNQFNETPLLSAALFGRADAVRRLIERGADLDIRNQWDRTALDLTERYDNHNPHEQPLAPRMREWIADREGGWRHAAGLYNALSEIMPKELLVLMMSHLVRLSQIAVKDD